MLRFRNIIKYSSQLRYFSQSRTLQSQFIRPGVNVKSNKDIGPLGWFLLLIPATTFGLGTWQVQRKKWKENLILELRERTATSPVPLPEDLSELQGLEYYPVQVKGQFLHDKELYMGPRSLLKGGNAASEGGLISKRDSSNAGYLVVTPFKLADRDLTILVNRGWVPQKNKNPITRPKGQITDEVNIVGIVRLNEKRAAFMPNNRPESNSWFHRDLNEMARRTNSSPVFLDIISECDVEGGPTGGQTRISLRNEHLSYIFTWYSLCGFTSFMWYNQFIKKMPPI